MADPGDHDLRNGVLKTRGRTIGFRPFRRCEDGSLTIEVLLWLPIVMLVLGLIVDVSMIYQGHSVATRVLQDANRNLATGRGGSLIALQDPTLEAARIAALKTYTQNYVRSKLAGVSNHATVTTQIVGGIATTSVVMPASDLDGWGLFGTFRAAQVVVESQMYLER